MSIVANRYARALLSYLPPADAEGALRQLTAFSGVLNSSKEIRRLLENPTITRDKRETIIQELGGALGLTKPVLNFIMTMAENRRVSEVPKVVAAYERFLDDLLGVVPVEVTVASEITPEQQARLSERINVLTGKKVKMRVRVDRSLIGGMVARIGGTIYDGSISQKLRNFRNQMAAG